MTEYKSIFPRKLLICLGLAMIGGAAFALTRSGDETISMASWFVLAFCAGGVGQLLGKIPGTKKSNKNEMQKSGQNQAL